MPAESNIGSSRSPLDVVGGYLARGWSPIPIPPKSKAPRANGWQKMRLAKADLPSHFTAHSNVGILLGEPSGWLVDVDLDHQLAIEWADQFLPKTGAEFGRSGAPRSHRLYRVTAPIDTHKRQLPDKAMVVELRSTGCQTVFPVSVHPSGEIIEWSSDGEPAEVDPQALVNALDALADWVVILVDAATPEPHEGDKRSLTLSALAGLSPARADSYHEWVAVGMALHSVGADDEMLAVWNEWSRMSAKYQEGKDECAAKWRGFGRKPGVTLGTLIHFARQDGWQAPYERNGKGTHPVTNPLGTAKPTKAKRRPVPVDPYKPFPCEALPEPLRSFVAEAAKAVGCDQSYVALPLLAALAATIGNKRRIKLKHGKSGWCEPSVVWCAIVGESGTLKSPALDHALAPLRRRQTKALREYREAVRQYERDVLTHDGDYAEWKKSGHKKGEPPPEPPEEPKCERFIVSDITVEALIERLQDNPNGLLLERDELAGWMGSFNQYKGGRGGDVAQFLSMHRAGQVLSDRKTGRKILFAERGAVSGTWCFFG